MLIDDAKPEELDRLKEVKVRIPVRYHIQLLSMKVLTGKHISDAVSEALHDYFARIRDARPGAPERAPEGPLGSKLR